MKSNIGNYNMNLCFTNVLELNINIISYCSHNDIIKSILYVSEMTSFVVTQQLLSDVDKSH